MQKIKNRQLGALIGLAIGDAFGAPYEFLTPPYTVDTSHYTSGGAHDVEIGEWTDDTSMALCLAKSLIDCNGFNLEDQLNKYTEWYLNGYMSTRGYCFDIGNTTEMSILQFNRSGDIFTKYIDDSFSGNGSIMRLAPIAIKYFNEEKDLLKFAELSSKTTHGSQKSIEGCLFLAKLLSGAIKGVSKDVLLDIEFYKELNLSKELSQIVEGSFKNKIVFKNSGYVFDTIESSLAAFWKFDDFKSGLDWIVSLGNDTDTAGAVYGQMAGSYYGLNGIPENLKNDLLWYDEIFRIADEL